MRPACCRPTGAGLGLHWRTDMAALSWGSRSSGKTNKHTNTHSFRQQQHSRWTGDRWTGSGREAWLSGRGRARVQGGASDLGPVIIMLFRHAPVVWDCLLTRRLAPLVSRILDASGSPQQSWHLATLPSRSSQRAPAPPHFQRAALPLLESLRQEHGKPKGQESVGT